MESREDSNNDDRRSSDRSSQEATLESQLLSQSDTTQQTYLSADDQSTTDEESICNPGGEQIDEVQTDIEVEVDNSAIRAHPSYEQVMLDVNRCAGRLEHIRQCYFHRTDADLSVEDMVDKCRPKYKNEDLSNEETRPRDQHMISERISRLEEDLNCQRKLKKKLAKLIVKLLIEKPYIHYYQGFHDVCLTYMTLYGDKLAYERLDRLIDSHFLQFMHPTMLPTQEFLALIPIIVGLHDDKVQDFLELAEVGTIFALSWTITWFSHVIPNERDVESIFNFLQSFDDPHVILYLCANVVLYKRDELLKLEPEMSAVHHYLSQIPRKEKLPMSLLLKQTEISFTKWPPNVIKKRLDDYRKLTLQVHNYNLIQNLTQRIIPNLTRWTTPRTALVVIVLASALAFQWDKLLR